MESVKAIRYPELLGASKKKKKKNQQDTAISEEA